MNAETTTAADVGALTIELQASESSLARTNPSQWVRIAAVSDVAFVVFLGAIGALRFHVFDSVAEPSGIDPGNWLAFGHALLGSHSRSSSIVYPPLVPLLTMVFGAIWGPFTGTKLLAVISSLAPSAGTYVLLRPGLGSRALFVAGVLAPAASTGEAAAWGGYPQLLGLGLLALMLCCLNRCLETRSRAWLIASSIVLFLTVAASDIIGAVAVVIAILLIVLRVLLLPKRDRPSARLVIGSSLAGALPLLALAPTYFALIGGVIHNEATRSSNQTALLGLHSYLDNVFKDGVGWYLFLLIALLSPFILVFRRQQPIAAASTAILVPTIAALAIVGEFRLAYLLPIGIAVGVGAWWMLLSSSNRPLAVKVDRALIAIAPLVLFAESLLGITAFQAQVNWYEVLTPREVAGLYQLDSLAPQNATLAVSPGPGRAAQQAWPFGWWVEGLLDRPTYYASNPAWLNFSDERARSNVANQLFNPTKSVSDAVELARSGGISFIVVLKDWPSYPAWASNGASLDGATVVIDTDALLVISTNG